MLAEHKVQQAHGAVEAHHNPYVLMRIVICSELEVNMDRRQVFETRVSLHTAYCIHDVTNLRAHRQPHVLYECSCLGETLPQTHLLHMQALPYRWIGFLRCADSTRCTGALVSDRHVLTAGADTVQYNAVVGGHSAVSPQHWKAF